MDDGDDRKALEDQVKDLERRLAIVRGRISLLRAESDGAAPRPPLWPSPWLTLAAVVVALLVGCVYIILWTAHALSPG